MTRKGADWQGRQTQAQLCPRACALLLPLASQPQKTSRRLLPAHLALQTTAASSTPPAPAAPTRAPPAPERRGGSARREGALPAPQAPAGWVGREAHLPGSEGGRRRTHQALTPQSAPRRRHAQTRPRQATPASRAAHLLRVHVGVLAGAGVLLQAASELRQFALVAGGANFPQLGGHKAVEYAKVPRQAAPHRSHLHGREGPGRVVQQRGWRGGAHG